MEHLFLSLYYKFLIIKGFLNALSEKWRSEASGNGYYLL
ncbi:hypothetical protein NT05LM_1897 [Listeria marthii FSL S4-120]|uniref:Uncharacterized protein n=1 Tax=Listeria marthii FSL S4-120 TaxID=702457 RepID=A0ABP2JXI9_9LIST|nr:hypothetical protein NT05LM_1897 [Listeria marthii FSL S4-120]